MSKTVSYNDIKQKKQNLDKSTKKVEPKPTIKGGDHVARSKPIVTKVKREKKSFGAKLIQSITGKDTDGTGVTGYLLEEIILPAAKDMLVNAITSGTRMLIYGKDDGGRSSSSNTYHSSYRPSTNYQRSYSRGPVDNGPVQRTNHFNASTFLLDDRAEAEDVLATLQEQINEYGSASIADFYDLLGIESSYTDNTYGWSDLRTGRIIMKRNGYALDLPQVEWFR